MAKKKVALLSNITSELIGQHLASRYDIYLPGGYNTWVSEIFNEKSELYQRTLDAVIVLLDGTRELCRNGGEEARNYLETWLAAVKKVAAHMESVPIFVSAIDVKADGIRAFSEPDRAVELRNRWYQDILRLSQAQNNIYLYDFADRIDEVGRQKFYSSKMWYMASMPYSIVGIQETASMLDTLLQNAFEPRRKLVVLDLDNTLWGGVVGEDGVDGIQLSRYKEGARYYDFQRQLLKMKERGTLLAVCSKNNPEDVREVFEKHPDMVLHEQDFVALEINWGDKASGIVRMAKNLNLTESAVIFIDDNPMEREQVRAACPEVLVPEFPRDTTQLPEFAEEIYERYLRPLRVLQEDSQKTEMYHAREKREQERNQSGSLAEYIAKLEMQADIHVMREEEQQRVVQLCQKTNQFNVTTKRYTESEIAQLCKKLGTTVFVAYAKDKYGDEGLVGVVIAAVKGREVFFDTFLMSCRVMGRELERVIMDVLLGYYSRVADTAAGRYVRTAKNTPVEHLYETLGFELSHETSNEKLYRRDIRNFTYVQPKMYKQVIFHAEPDAD